ncbi:MULTISPECIES: O-methyltransferase [unclassified Streptomyces]|uniref:O-methyltransferase n=1 Tax=unclassified Streptomyces TaxID=2593676 RepID=UPI00278C5FFD|nr:MULTISPECIES: class I SAM-dependent methyltransferase [unclassified Streptomyces]
MPSTTHTRGLHDPAVRKVLDRLFAEAVADETKTPSVAGTLTAWKGEPSADELRRISDDVAHDALLPVPPEVGTLLYQLVRATGATTVVEYGTSYGISAIHLAAAVRDNGGGRVIGSELNETKAKIATANIAEAGLAEYVEVRVGDARETLPQVEGPIGLLLLDGWTPLFHGVLRLLEPKLTVGSVVVADDTSLFPEKLTDYFAHVRGADSGYTSTPLPIGDGLELSVRTS